ncbi:MAG: hypothetical protein KBF73_09610 [Flavobacteriales bacterium]|nr:hypothetical protein [Flavobacteriales bacterium]
MKKAIMMVGFAAAMLTATTGCKKTCDDWHELEDKDCVEMREKFYGTYVGTMTSNGQTQNISTTLASNGNVQRITWDGSQYLELSGETTVDIPLQNVYDQSGTYSIEGAGSLNGSQLVLNFVATYQGQTVVINFTGTK